MHNAAKSKPSRKPRSGSVSKPNLYPDQGELLEEIADLVADPVRWLITPNDQFGGRAPGTLIGTKDEDVFAPVGRSGQVRYDVMNLGASPNLRRGPMTGTWYRAVPSQHWNTLNQTVHSRIYPRRFNGGTAANPSFEAVYLAENFVVALFEAEAVFGAPVPGGFVSQPRQNWVLINVDVQLQEVADLTDVAEQNKLGTTAQELTGDWRGYLERRATTSISQPTGLAPTQQLGAALFAVPRLEAFQTISAKLPYHRCLVIMPQKLLPGSRVEFYHPATGQKLTIP